MFYLFLILLFLVFLILFLLFHILYFEEKIDKPVEGKESKANKQTNQKKKNIKTRTVGGRTCNLTVTLHQFLRYQYSATLKTIFRRVHMVKFRPIYMVSTHGLFMLILHYQIYIKFTSHVSDTLFASHNLSSIK